MKIYIEGIIASGKSTLCKMLEKELCINAHYEIATQETQRMLELFYSDQKRYSFLTQIHFLVTRHRHAVDPRPAIYDRSLFGDAVFANVLFSDGMMSHEEYREYTGLLDEVLGRECLKPSLLIYLHCEPSTAFKRVEQRKRACEAGIPLDYLEKLNKSYLTWLEEYRQANTSNVLYINTDSIDLITDTEKTQELVNQIKIYFDTQNK